MAIEGTLCFIENGKKFLLLKKSTGFFGEGKWNAPGGKLKINENAAQAAVREVFEETGLSVSKLKKCGILYFYEGDRENPKWIVHVFLTDSFEGDVKASAEGKLKWFDKDELPFNEMWEDDRHWLPLLMAGKKFKGTFYFNENFNNLLEHNLKIVSSTD